MTLAQHLRPQQFELIAQILARETGIHLSAQKQDMVASRLQRRMRELGMSRIEEYLHLLDDEYRHEVPHLINALTTNKTEFFREPSHFEILSALLANELRSPVTYVWCAACSTGEEAYTLAMVATEALRSTPRREIRLLASDIDTTVLAKAQAGLYTPEETAGVPSALLGRYFAEVPLPPERPPWLRYYRGQTLWQACPQLQPHIKFRRHNLLDKPLLMAGMFHAIFLRNALIYMSPEATATIMDNMAQALRPGGYLFLGHSESAVCSHPHFEPVAAAVARKKR